MTQDEIIEMARQAGFVIHIHKPSLITVENEETWVCVNKELEAFAKLITAKEREEIAEFIDSTELGSLPEATAIVYARLLKSYSTAIRARGDTV